MSAYIFNLYTWIKILFNQWFTLLWSFNLFLTNGLYFNSCSDPADIGWPMKNVRISNIGRHWLAHDWWTNLEIGWPMTHVSHGRSMAVGPCAHDLHCCNQKSHITIYSIWLTSLGLPESSTPRLPFPNFWVRGLCCPKSCQCKWDGTYHSYRCHCWVLAGGYVNRMYIITYCKYII